MIFELTHKHRVVEQITFYAEDINHANSKAFRHCAVKGTDFKNYNVKQISVRDIKNDKHDQIIREFD